MTATTGNQKLKDWVDEWREIFQPDDVYWCDGSAEEYDRFCREMVESGTFTALSEAKRPTATWRCPIPAMWLASRTARSSAAPTRSTLGPPTTGGRRRR